MKIYLRFINPVVSAIVLALCVFAAGIDGFFGEPLGIYFLAKGIFCGFALFIMGKILEVMITHKK